MSKWLCNDCGWNGAGDEYLVAPNPFDSEEEITGCPRCRQVNTLEQACDEPGCRRRATCGTPAASGYRNTCYEHNPFLNKENKP